MGKGFNFWESQKILLRPSISENGMYFGIQWKSLSNRYYRSKVELEQLCSDLDLHHMYRVPAAFNFLGAISRFFNKNDASKTVVQVPQIHGGDSALEIPAGQSNLKVLANEFGG